MTNCVIAGDYVGSTVQIEKGVAYIYDCSKMHAAATVDYWEMQFDNAVKIWINKQNVETYEILDQTVRKSASSAVGRAAVGAALLGPVGLLAGVSAKSKGTYTIAVMFKDGKNSLIEVDDKTKNAIMTRLF